MLKKQCFHRVPRLKKVLCTNFQPKKMIFIFWPVFGGPLDPGGWEMGGISQVPKGFRGKSFQDILRGPYRCKNLKKTRRAYLIPGRLIICRLMTWLIDLIYFKLCTCFFLSLTICKPFLPESCKKLPKNISRIFFQSKVAKYINIVCLLRVSEIFKFLPTSYI